MFIRHVIHAKETDPAVDVFTLMSHNGVSAVALVDESNAFSGVLSAIDIKGVDDCCEQFMRLSLPAIEFLAPVRRMNVVDTSPTIGIRQNHSFGTALHRLAVTHVHRLFVTNEEYHLVGVVSIGDILRVIRDCLSDLQ